MTITLTVEEAAKYESLVLDWMGKRSRFAVEWLQNNRGGEYYGPSGSFTDPTKYTAALKEYDKANPMPRLLPNI